MARVHDLVRVFEALRDPTRLRILGLLTDGELCVCHIHEALRAPQPTISRHLAYLRRAGLVVTRREGTWMFYRAASHADASVHEAITAAIAAVRRTPVAAADRSRLAGHGAHVELGLTSVQPAVS